MDFIDALTEIAARVEGCIAGAIIGIDGIVIEHYLAPDESLDIDVTATESTTLLRHSRKTASDTQLGDLQEMVVAADQRTFLLRQITPEYFLLLVLEPRSSVGRARYELRKAQLSLEAEFAI